MKIPQDYPVQPLAPNDNAKGRATCGHCGLSWDDDKVTEMTPTPSGRCPFEPFHEEETDEELRQRAIKAARDLYGTDDIEIDDDAKLSTTDDGVWVQAWVWVHNEDMPESEVPA